MDETPAMLQKLAMIRIHLIAVFGLTVLVFSSAIRADSDLPEASEAVSPAKIELADQTVIYGQITDIHDGELYVTTALMGEVVVSLSSITYLKSEEAIELLTTEQEKLALTSLMVVDGEVVLDDADNLTVDQLDVANPEEWEQGHGYRITGRATSAIEYNRGNTETDKLNLDAESIFESRRDRITLRADYEDSSALVTETNPDDGTPVQDAEGNDVKTSQSTADNWRVEGKYDYFLTDPRNYLGLNLGFRSNEFADIDRRQYASAYFGRKILTRDTLTFDAEMGVSYVDTNFTDSVDDSYTGININFTGEAQLFGSKVALYLRQANIVNLSSAEKSIYRTKVGLRFPLFLGLEAAAEASADYDGGAAEGKDKLDQALKFRVGYTW